MRNFLLLLGLATGLVVTGVVGALIGFPDLRLRLLSGITPATPPVAEVVIPETPVPEDRPSREVKMTEDEVEALAGKLMEEQKRIVEQKAHYDRLSDVLQNRLEEVARINAETQAIRGEIAQFIHLISETEEKNLRKLARMFETLSPANATPLIGQMKDETVVNVFALMKPRNSAKLLGAFAAENDGNAFRAARITQLLKHHAVMTQPDTLPPVLP